MKKVIATLFQGSYPILILEDGTVMAQVLQPENPHAERMFWELSWEVSSQYTAEVVEAVAAGGSPGYNITVFENGRKVGFCSTAT